MFDLIQKYKGFFLFVFVLSAAGLVISMFSNPGQNSGGQFSVSQVVARVEGKEITAQDLIRAYQYQRQTLMDEIQQRAGGDTSKNAEMRKYLETLIDMRLTPDSVVQELVQENFVIRTAEKLGIQSSPEIIKDLIQNDPRFQKEGRFDPLLYKQKVSQTGLFEEDVGRRAAVYRMSELFQAGLAYHSPSERELEKWLNQKSKFGILTVSSKSFPEPKDVSQNQIDAFLADTASEAVLSDFYNRNLSRFSSAEEVKARHILLKGPNAKDEAQKILAEIQGTKIKFEEAALKYSQDPSNASKGGDLGFFGRGVMDPAFEKAAFGLKPGELSKEPVESQFGFHLIQVDEKKEAKIRSLAEVKTEITKEALLEKLKKENALKFLGEITAGKIPSAQDLKRLNLNWSEAVTWGPMDENLGALGQVGGDDRSEILKLNASKEILPKYITRGDSYYLVRWLGVAKEGEESPQTKNPSAPQLANASDPGAWEEAKAQSAYRYFLQTRFEALEKSNKIYKSEKILQQFREVLKKNQG